MYNIMYGILRMTKYIDVTKKKQEFAKEVDADLTEALTRNTF